MMFGRQVRTTWDLLRSDIQGRVFRSQERMKQKVQRPARVLATGSAVWVKNFIGKAKWLPGSVIAQSGPLSYKAEMAGNMVRRHVDHLLVRQASSAVSEFGPASDSMPTELVSVPLEGSSDSPITSSFQPNPAAAGSDTPVLAAPLDPAAAISEPAGTPLRHSERVRCSLQECVDEWLNPKPQSCYHKFADQYCVDVPPHAIHSPAISSCYCSGVRVCRRQIVHLPLVVILNVWPMQISSANVKSILETINIGDPLPGNVLLGADAAILHLYYEKLRSIQRPYTVFPVIYSPPL
ncbi:hypothetical protein EOD39_9148 [Acipenser ruthenus]|uniref:Uncharacterized protein n=1 Tax=Acipenser ruthenus TaxID=7906 RepID=A0A444U1P5_ACIRT|nr:hypothetical protein EOD39_9148 [Acipenser ruthenus]